MGFLWRWLFAFVLLAATYNPTHWNYVAWAAANGRDQIPLAVLLGLVLFIVYVVFVTAVLRGIGILGVVLLLALVGALIWFLADSGWLGLDNRGVNTWIALLALSVVLATGMYWGILWRRLSGQIEVDDNDS